jgi:hypothetical protein
MALRYTSGVRLERLTVDPSRPAQVAFWTHRPARRPKAGRLLASMELATTWPDALGIPMGRGAIAMGHRIELLPTGYGPGGAALMLTRDGRRTLVVGPTTDGLQARPVDQLALFVPSRPTPPVDWLERASEATEPLRIVVPDGGAALHASQLLTAAGVPYRCPSWLQGGVRRAKISITTRGPGLEADLRPQADEVWLADFAARTGPELVLLHGPRADHVAVRLARLGLATRVLAAPQQMTLAGIGLSARQPLSLGRDEGQPPNDEEARPDD